MVALPPHGSTYSIHLRFNELIADSLPLLVEHPPFSLNLTISFSCRCRHMARILRVTRLVVEIPSTSSFYEIELDKTRPLHITSFLPKSSNHVYASSSHGIDTSRSCATRLQPLSRVATNSRQLSQGSRLPFVEDNVVRGGLPPSLDS